MKKTSFLTLEKAKEIAAQIPTPFHIIGAVLIVAGSLVEIIEFKGKRRLKNVSEKQ